MTMLWLDKVLAEEFDEEFVRKMRNRVATSFFKYGAAKKNFTERQVGGLLSAKLRLDEYERTHNTEYLIDAANYLMFEFRWPSISGAFFQATDSDGSPGNVLRDGTVVKGGLDDGEE